jgi:3-hydroxyacyl-CoA dehydrogenase/enoyl-CoA hydratase/3-hydroxybutyryl-CoA epimerase
MTFDTLRYERDGDGIVTVTFDDPDQSTNTMRAAFLADYVVLAGRLRDEADELTGVVFTSGKPTVFAGGDLRDMIRATADDVAAITERLRTFKRAMRTIETLGVPVVAAINGSALGGGCELTLVAHHRIALDDPRLRIGQPEVTFGLLPGAGGCTRIPRMLGIVDALTHVLLRGQQHPPARALEVGLIDALATDHDDLLDQARAWIRANPDAAQPWDRPGYRIPATAAPALPARLRKELKGAHYDAPHHILAAVIECAQVPVDRSFEIETRYLVDLLCNSAQAKNMMQAFFFDLQAINRGRSRPDGHDRWRASKVAVLGAGRMGSAIAYQCAKVGLAVVLTDVNAEAAEEGKGYSRRLVARDVERGRIDQDRADALLARITPTADAADVAGCDLVIEAVFESADLKRRVFGAVEPIVADDALLCSNTSTIPITTLAEGVARRDDFVGLHFFSPVDKMPLVEIIRGRQTSDAAVARAFDVVRQLRKTPIVVNDARGFFTSRVIGTFVNEAIAALGEGVHPVTIERAALAAGYPTPPLQLMDELTLTLPRRIRLETQAAAATAGDPVPTHPADAVIDRMIDEFGREGRAAGAGFYDYDADGARTGLWPGLAEHFTDDATTHIHPGDDELLVDLSERMLFAEAIETVRCLDEGVITGFPDANIGSLFGIGFPRWTGGAAQYIDQYPGGTTGFVARCKALADRYGDRFTPPENLVALAEAGDPLRPEDTRLPAPTSSGPEPRQWPGDTPRHQRTRS